MKITLLEPLGISDDILETYATELRKKGNDFVAYDTKTSDPAELIVRTGDSDIVIIANTPYPDAVVKAAPNLKLLNVAFTGIDHIGQQACRQKGVTVCNAAGYSTQCVAELALGLTVSCLRSLPICDLNTRAGGTGAGLRGGEIFGKTVGIVGTGAIGTAVARIFLAFGARVIAYSRTVRPGLESIGVKYVSLDELMKESDIVSVHVPSNAETKGMISAERIALMKPSAILINAARGAVVDNEALAEALNAGEIAGAGIDVYDMEPPIPDNYPLRNAKNTVLTPHVAFDTQESMLRRAEIVFANVDAYLAGKPQNICRL